MTTPGFGVRAPEVAALLDARTPAANGTAVWGEWLRLDWQSFVGPETLPAAVVTSVRCMVFVDGRLLCGRNPGNSHPWPGGRRESGESYADTAAREVHEETGWHIDTTAVRPVGWLRYTHRDPMPEGYQLPYPDFLQLVVTTTAAHRDPDHVRDADGFELESWLTTPSEALARPDMQAEAIPFLEALTRPA